ncbi:MAG: chaperonin GroEL, partial [Romboutsia sp.]|nr:chaperonin GroEL [Romboutsia sp.]
ALTYPTKQICYNAGISGDVVIDNIINGQFIDNFNYGYNAKTETYGDLIDMGVIDPAKAVRVALENAASVAGLFLTTECVIVDDLD